MRYVRLALCLTASALLGAHCAWAQDMADVYNRAYDLGHKFNADKVYYSGVAPQWLADSHRFWYVRNTPQGPEYVVVDAAAKKGQRKPLLDSKALAQKLSQQTGREIAPKDLRLQRMAVSDNCDTVRFQAEGFEWTFLPAKGQLAKGDKVKPSAPKPSTHWMELDDERAGGDFNGLATWDGFAPDYDESEAAEITSPDGRYAAFVRNSNVWVRDNESGQERQLSIDGTLGNYYSKYLQWSPDSKKIAVNKIRPAEKRYVYYVESSPKGQLQPILHKQEYTKPGDELRFKVPCIFNVETGEAAIPETSLFASQYDLSGPQWDADSRAVTFEFNERGHKHYRLLQLSEDGTVTPLIEEAHDKYVNYPRIYRLHLSDGKRILWSSERDNYNHLYMYDRRDLAHPRQITQGPWYVRSVVHVDEPNETIYFTANGVDPNEDPYNVKYYRINFDGSGMTCLTPDEGMHQARFSRDMRYLTDVYSTPTTPPVAKLRSAADGSEIMLLETADISPLLAEGWQAPEVFAAPGRDGKTMMWGLIQRPSNFDPAKSYPIIEYIYQGPGDHYVPKTFIPNNRYMTSLAELGFIVVMVDGMGTSFRSRDFENVCYKNLQDAGLPDHIAWIKAAAEKYPYMDTERVGIYGCSAGGQESTAAVLFHPEFYKCAYSACGCHDNRMDKIWWNELWMGYPIDEAYSRASNVDNAHLLTRPLMLVVGELDDNVDPASTMQVVDALIRANKDFELVVVPGAHHTVGEAFGEHKRWDFFVRHLQGQQPPAWSELKY